MNAYPADAVQLSSIAIPDLVITVLYNYDLTHGKEVLGAFLNFVNTEFCFVWRNLRGGPSLQFHIEREGDIVLVGFRNSPKIS